MRRSRTTLTSLAGALAGSLLIPAAAPAAATNDPPAAGAAIDQVIIATSGALVLTTLMLALVIGHRTGRVNVFGRLAGVAERVTGLPGWSALPGTVLGGALIIAVFGMYWDVAIHLDKGRDPGPLANPAHYFILVGLFGVLFAGVMAISLPLRGAGRAEVTLPNGWRAPVGGLLVAACGALSLSAFPLDDVWHRLFGQDVTLWGPTHLMLIGGASLSVLGAWVLHVEGAAERLAQGARDIGRWARSREYVLAGALLVGLSTFQDEFDMGVPQFRMIFHPLLLVLAAGVGLVAARIRLGRGGALATVGVFVALRLFLSLMVGPVLGRTVPHLPLYVVEGLLVELVALRLNPLARPTAFGAVAGAAIGTIGVLGEWAWSHVWVVVPWPGSLMPEALALGLPMGLAAGVVGSFIGRALTADHPRKAPPRWAVPLAALAVVAILGFVLPMTTPSHPIRATIATRTIQPGEHRTISANIRLDPPNAADGAEWLNITGWQGGGSVIDPLRRTGPGTYVTTKPIPVWGKWKTTLRLHKGREVLGLPIFLPADRAIPAPAVPVSPRFSRTFVYDKKNLQREQKPGVAGWLTLGAYLAVLALALVILGGIAAGLKRVERSLRAPAVHEPGERSRAAV